MLDNVVWIVIYTVAVYRFTLMIYEEDGPFFIFVKLRSWTGVSHTLRYDVDTTTGEVTNTYVDEVVSDNFLAQLLNCPYCISVWLAVIAALGVYYHWFDFLAVVGCIAGIIHYVLKRLYY